MTYALGVDLGTTFTSAAVFDEGAVEMFSFQEGLQFPSAAAVDDDGSIRYGATAIRSLIDTPERVAIEFKRRFGSFDPFLLGGHKVRPEDLQAGLLRHVLRLVEAERGSPPAGITLCHPATWSNSLRQLLLQAVSTVTSVPVSLLSEPEAAANWYAQKKAMQPGQLLAVYDLGGGTFDVAVIRRTVDGFEFVTEPGGDERLGGIDFDDAVWDHVDRCLGGQIQALDYEDPDVVSMCEDLRLRCVEAKIALSTATEATIRITLPGIFEKVRITRGEFEALIRVPVERSVELFEEVLASAGLAASDLDAVLLVGGSSRVPYVQEIVHGAISAEVRVDAHPKHAIAMGAAWFAGATHLGSEPPVPLRRRELSDRAELGARQWRERRFEEAEKSLTAALGLEPDDSYCLAVRADVRRIMYDSEGAWSDANRAIELDPRHALARTVRGALLRSAGDFRGAHVELTHALESQPEAAWPLALLSDVLLNLDRVDEAAKSAAKALAYNSDLVFAVGRLGECHRVRGENDQARRLFERVLTLEPHNRFAQDRLAMLPPDGGTGE